MKFRFLLKSSVKTIILILYLSTLYGRIKSDKRSKIISQTKHQKQNTRLKTNLRITDKYFSEFGTNISDESVLPNSSEPDVEDISLYAGFGISKPKPWRKDDQNSIALNENSVIVSDPDKESKGPAPVARSRSDSPALNMISQKGCGVSEVKRARIVNGKDAQAGAYPWMVAILKGGDPWCGGSIINERWILTAGHCFMGDLNNRLYAIRVGTIDRNTGTTYKVDKVIVHERFHLDNMFNSDIALLKVNRPIKLGNLVRPICVPTKAYEGVRSSTLLVIGWGQTSYENKDLPTILQEVLLNRVKISDCAKKYKTKGNNIYLSQLCTWNKGQDACQGDSGAPAIEWRNEIAYIVGIVSYGSTCADEMPGVYTKVSYFIDWILRKLYEDNDNKEMTQKGEDFGE